MAKLIHSMIRVQDPERSIAFYQRGFGLAGQDLVAELAAQTSRQHDEPVAPLVQQIAVDDRARPGGFFGLFRALFVGGHVVGIGASYQLAKVLVALQVLAKQDQLVKFGKDLLNNFQYYPP